MLNSCSVWLIAAALLIGGCASAPPRESPPLVVQPALADAAVDTAMQMVGTPYRFGGATPAAFDCSGLVYYSYLQAGLRLPRRSELQYRQATPLPLAQARRGDLVFFRIDGAVSHVGIYLGEGRFIHAPGAGRKVQQASLNTPYYQRHLIGAGRVDFLSPR